MCYHAYCGYCYTKLNGLNDEERTCNQCGDLGCNYCIPDGLCCDCMPVVADESEVA